MTLGLIFIQLVYQKMKELIWTSHAQMKMNYYKLAQSRVKRVIRSYERIEEGIADGTIAMMQPYGNKKDKEIWVMVADKRKKRYVVSAWRYPGRTKPGEPLPKEILEEFRFGSDVWI